MRAVFCIYQFLLKSLTIYFFCAIFAAAGSAQSVRRDADFAAAPPLKSGDSVEGVFSIGAAQNFAFRLETNQIASIVLQQKGVDAGIALENADTGKTLFKINVNGGNYGFERALIAAGDAPLNVLARVFPAKKDASGSGKFSLALGEIRTAQTGDELRIAAQTSISEAAQLLTEDDKEGWTKAVGAADKALKNARASRDATLEAAALMLLQAAYQMNSEADKSIEFGTAALPLLSGAENDYFRLVAGERLGAAWSDSGNAGRGVEILVRSLTEVRNFENDPLKIRTLIDLGNAYLLLNDSAKAIELINQALQISTENGDIENRIRALSMLGSVYTDRGDPLEVVKILTQAIALGEESGIKPARIFGSIYTTISAAYIDMGQMQKSLEYDQKSLELTRNFTGNKFEEAVSLINLSQTYEKLGQTARSINYLQQAMQILNRLNFKEAARINLDLQGGIYLKTKEFEKAKEIYTEALRLAQADTPPDLIRVKNSYFHLGFIERNLGNFNRALDNYLKAARQAEEMKLQNSAVSYFGTASVIYLLLGQPAKAEELAAQVLKTARDFGDRITESNALYTLARARRAQNDLTSARQLIEDALKIVESTRSELISQENRTGYLSMVSDKYDFYVSLLIEMRNQSNNDEFGAQAFAVNERARARGLLDLLAESYTNVSAGISPALKERERAVNARTSLLQTQLIRLKSAEKPDEKRFAELQKDIEKSDEERENLEQEIRRTNPRYANLKNPATVDLRQTQAMLDDKTVLLEYQIGADASYLFAVGKNEFQIVKLPNENALRDSVETLHKSISTPARVGMANYLLKGRELYKTLLAPIENLLKTKTKIIVAADGALHYLPFEVLLKDDRAASFDQLPYLVRDFDISYTPSASVLANLKNREDAAKPAKSFLAFAAPDYDTKTANKNLPNAVNTRSILNEDRAFDLTDLQFAKLEATRIAALFPAGQSDVFTGANATEERVKSADLLGQYRYLHFAVHGLIDEQQPQFSSLVLSLPKQSEQSQIPNPKSQILEDGLLQTPEIFNLKLRADLVTLSACETGLGQEMRGEGMVGLTRAFFYAGTPSVLVSLWKVDDASTAELMTLFYENLRKNGERDKAAALRETQLKLIAENRYAHPFYWAAFILQGKTSSNF